MYLCSLKKAERLTIQRIFHPLGTVGGTILGTVEISKRRLCIAGKMQNSDPFTLLIKEICITEDI